MIMEKTEVQNLVRMSMVASITYLDGKPAKPKFKELGYEVVMFLDVEGAQGYVLKNDNHICFSFRGTEPRELSDIKADIYAARDENVPYTPGKVHRGFKQELDKLWPFLLKYLKEECPKNVVVTGHSLGAAIATLFCSRILDFNPILYTFGSPRVGNILFTNHLFNENLTHYRVQNNNDLVCTVPPKWLLYKHHGQNVYMNTWGHIRNLNPWQKFKDKIRGRIAALKKGQIFDGLRDHSMVKYVKYLTQNS